MTDLTIPSTPSRLGQSDLEVSPLAWGMWRFRGTDLHQAATLVHTALECGMTLLDTADIYGPDNGEAFGAAETLLGRVLAQNAGLRRRMVLASKGGIVPGVPYNSSRDYLVAACEASLQRLQTDHLDLYQIHRPDSLAHPAEVAAALDTLRRTGKIIAAGVSNYSAAQTRALHALMSFPLASTQPELSALRISALGDGVLDLAQELSINVLAWSPLAGGRLSGAGIDNREQAVIAALDVMAEQQDLPRSAVACAWIMAHPAHPIPIVGSQTAARIRQAARAMEVKMSRADWYAILTASRQERLP